MSRCNQSVSKPPPHKQQQNTNNLYTVWIFFMCQKYQSNSSIDFFPHTNEIAFCFKDYVLSISYSKISNWRTSWNGLDKSWKSIQGSTGIWVPSWHSWLNDFTIYLLDKDFDWFQIVMFGGNCNCSLSKYSWISSTLILKEISWFGFEVFKPAELIIEWFEICLIVGWRTGQNCCMHFVCWELSIWW